MNKYDLLKNKLNGCEPVIMANTIVNTSPAMLSAFERADCVLLDKEHGLYDSEGLFPFTMKCRAMGLPAIVRVEEAQYHLIAKSMDLGADGIMLPRTETSEQIRIAVDGMFFPPKGRTGCGGALLFRNGESIAEYNNNRLLFIQIESEKGLNNMEAMIKEYGEYISGFIMGPNDYSISMGVPFQLDHPIMLEQYRKFYGICNNHNISCGIFDADNHFIERDAEMGANIFWISDDIRCMKAGFEQFADFTEKIVKKG